MKKTIYFTGQVSIQMTHIESNINHAINKRDAWITANESKIGKIDFEDIKITPYGVNHNFIMVTIQLTYYPK